MSCEKSLNEVLGQKSLDETMFCEMGQKSMDEMMSCEMGEVFGYKLFLL